ncbi:MAG: hypothetical protein SF029_23845 [bacterium]|nr:hypothetical protein [bacterium]
MPFRSMEQGIQAVQQGNVQEGARLLKIALKNPELKGALRATALAWLAETKSAREEKVQCYQEALQADPNNEDIRRRLAVLMAADLPPVPPPKIITQELPEAQPPNRIPPAPPASLPDAPTIRSAPPPPTTLPLGQETPIKGMPPVTLTPAPAPTVASPASTGFYRAVGIVDGPNGAGTAFFVTREGLLATTRLVVGGMEQVTVELEPGRQLPGRVARAFPEFDLALIETGYPVTQLLSVTPQPGVPENTPLTAFAHNGRVIPGQRRVSQGEASPNWFPTTITQLYDVGGNPIFDNRNFLVGMLTRNTSRESAQVYGLYIGTIYRCVEHYISEVRDGMGRVYCPSCGYMSRAAALGGFYCETCGSLLPTAVGIPRFPTPRPQVEVLYGENLHRPCTTCGSRVGYYNGRCLRCGAEIR